MYYLQIYLILFINLCCLIHYTSLFCQDKTGPKKISDGFCFIEMLTKTVQYFRYILLRLKQQIYACKVYLYIKLITNGLNICIAFGKIGIYIVYISRLYSFFVCPDNTGRIEGFLDVFW